jgi:hypothetical protein
MKGEQITTSLLQIKHVYSLQEHIIPYQPIGDVAFDAPLSLILTHWAFTPFTIHLRD